MVFVVLNFLKVYESCNKQIKYSLFPHKVLVCHCICVTSRREMHLQTEWADDTFLPHVPLCAGTHELAKSWQTPRVDAAPAATCTGGPGSQTELGRENPEQPLPWLGCPLPLSIPAASSQLLFQLPLTMTAELGMQQEAHICKRGGSRQPTSSPGAHQRGHGTAPRATCCSLLPTG